MSVTVNQTFHGWGDQEITLECDFTCTNGWSPENPDATYHPEWSLDCAVNVETGAEVQLTPDQRRDLESAADPYFAVDWDYEDHVQSQIDQDRGK